MQTTMVYLYLMILDISKICFFFLWKNALKSNNKSVGTKLFFIVCSEHCQNRFSKLIIKAKLRSKNADKERQQCRKKINYSCSFMNQKCFITITKFWVFACNFFKVKLFIVVSHSIFFLLIFWGFAKSCKILPESVCAKYYLWSSCCYVLKLP